MFVLGMLIGLAEGAVVLYARFAGTIADQRRLLEDARRRRAAAELRWTWAERDLTRLRVRCQREFGATWLRGGGDSRAPQPPPKAQP